MTTKTSSFPWEPLATAPTRGEFTARLVAETENPNSQRLYWAKDWAGQPAFLVKYPLTSWAPIALPSFRSIEVADYRNDGYLAVTLLDTDMSDIFFKVCLDIIGCLQEMPPKSLRKACILRLERWSYFLKPSRSRMSPEKQKGLMGELLFLKEDVLAALPASTALQGWVGPDAAPRDFEYGQTFIEVKSKRNSASSTIVISSEDQLNVSPAERLFLCVWELNAASADDPAAFTVTDTAESTRKALEYPMLQAEFDGKLASAGYFVEDDYTADAWTRGNVSYYEVAESFPRIDSASCPPGITKVRYAVDLDYCAPYEIDRKDLLDALEQLHG